MSYEIRIHSSLRLASLVAAAAAGTSSYVGAQELEEIVVTAERRETLLQDTPLSVLAFDSEALLNAGVGDVADLQHLAPGLKITGSRGNQNEPQFTLRGISPVRTTVHINC
jgi:iron complex outermembrane receptor protein